MTTQVMATPGSGVDLPAALQTHPSVPEGAQQGARLVTERDIRGNAGYNEFQSRFSENTPAENLEERRRRELATFRRWFQDQPKPERQTPPTVNDLESLIYDRLTEFFRRSPP